MAAAAHADPVAALDRLTRAYAGQHYTRRPGRAEVSRVCREVIAQVLSDGVNQPLRHPQHRLAVLTARGRGVLSHAHRERSAALGFSLAALANLTGRPRLSYFMERAVFHDRRESLAWMAAPFDAFTAHFNVLAEDSLAQVLLASGAIPFVLEAVRDIPNAPKGAYWDGGVVDYHLALPYSRLEDLVLYPHFVDYIVPGWLDKSLRWRRSRGEWLSNLILVAPSAEWVAGLPRGKLPDRSDFKHYGMDHQARTRAWLQAAAQSEQLGDDFARWAADPDPKLIRSLD